MGLLTSAALLQFNQDLITIAGKVIDSQTPEQKAIIWNRLLDVTLPIHNLILRIEGVKPTPVNPTPASPTAAAALSIDTAKG